MKLVKKVDLNDKVKLVCLPSSSLTDKAYNKLIIGVCWGRITTLSHGYHLKLILLSLDL
jgi:hypothetical protein